MSSEDASAYKTLAEREKQAQAFVNGGTLLVEDEPQAMVEKPNNDEKTGQGRTSSEYPTSSSAKKAGRPKKGVLVQNPAVRKALSKSRVQKTIRIPPMVMVEYEELCSKLGLELAFNEHINDAFSSWLEKKKKQQS